MPDFTIKQDDRREPFDRVLKGSDDQPVNLTGASVRFLMRGPGVGGPVKVNNGATIVDAPTGRVRYNWGALDTDTIGLFEAEWEVTFADATKQTFPNGGYLIVLVVGDIA